MKTNIKIYDIEYLKKQDLTEDDLHELFDKDAMLCSFIVHMFRVAGYKFNNNEIINKCHKKNWYNNYKISYKNKETVINDFANAMKNIYVLSDEIAKKYANDFYMMYGLRVRHSYK